MGLWLNVRVLEWEALCVRLPDRVKVAVGTRVVVQDGERVKVSVWRGVGVAVGGEGVALRVPERGFVTVSAGLRVRVGEGRREAVGVAPAVAVVLPRAVQVAVWPWVPVFVKPAVSDVWEVVGVGPEREGRDVGVRLPEGEWE